MNVGEALFTAVWTTYQSKLTFSFYRGKHIPKNLTKKNKKINNKFMFTLIVTLLKLQTWDWSKYQSCRVPDIGSSQSPFPPTSKYPKSQSGLRMYPHVRGRHACTSINLNCGNNTLTSPNTDVSDEAGLLVHGMLFPSLKGWDIRTE